MSLPKNAIVLIREYSKPLTRTNWRDGSNCVNLFKYSDELRNLHQIFLNYIISKKKNYEQYIKVIYHISFVQDLQRYAEDIFKLVPQSSLYYNNFYFILKKYGILKNSGKLLIIDLVCDNKKIKIIHASELGIKN